MFIPERYKSYVDAAWDYTVPGKGVLRSAAKTLTWRIIASTDTFLAAYFILPFILPLLGYAPVEASITFASGIAVFELVSKMILYFLHERVWAKVGRHRYPPKKRRVRINCRNCGMSNSKMVPVEPVEKKA